MLKYQIRNVLNSNRAQENLKIFLIYLIFF